jgi:retinol dehydrogenase-12
MPLNEGTPLLTSMTFRRSAAKAQAAIDDLYAATGKRAIFLSLDLGNLDSIKKSAQEFLL